MKRSILRISNFTTPLLALFFGIIWVNRLRLDYNSEGKYFDEANALVYDTDALVIYGILTIVFVLAAVIGWFLAWKLKTGSS